jgi:hypothetical protein
MVVLVTTDETPLLPIEGVFIDVARALKVPPQWIIPDVVPEGLLIIAGPPKESFKSTITMGMAAIIAGASSKALPADWTAARQGPVMVFSHEADAGELRFILEDGLGAVLAKDESILVAERPEEFMLDDEDGRKEMMHWLDARGPVLTFIDPLANFHNLEEKDASQMIQCVAPLRRWAKREHACICIVHHTRKLEEERNYKASDLRGTGALFGLCDGLIMLTPTQNPYELILDAKMKRGKAWIKTITLGAWDNKGQQGGEVLREVDKLIIKAIRLGYTSLAKICRHTALNERNVKPRLDKLTKTGYLKTRQDANNKQIWKVVARG